MSSLVFSIPSAPAASNASASSGAASSTAQARSAQSPADADAFGAALARSREARGRQADGKAETASDTPEAPTARRRGPGSTAQREETTPADLLAMAMLTPAFGMQAALQQQRAASAAQGGEAGAHGAAAAALGTAGEATALADAAADAADAHAPAPAGSASDTAATQAAQAKASELQDKDAKSAKAKSDALPALPEQKPSAPDVPVAAAAVPPQATAPVATANAAASTSAPATAAKATTDTSALPLQVARDAAPAEHHADLQTDASAAQLPGAFGFKTALAEAANASAPAQPQTTARYDVPTTVGSEGWGADIGTQIIRMGADGKHVAELSLNPAGLGPLKVTLTLGDNQAQAMFVSAHESVRRALEAALPQLRDTLAGQGIQLGQASVDAGAQQQQQQAFGQERAFEPAPGRQVLHDTGQAAANDAIEAGPAPAATRPRSASSIDTFA